MSHKLILVRHGLSDWNAQNRFTGWTDVDLSEAGIAEARLAASLLKDENLEIDVCYTSVLKRAIRTLWIVLDEMDLMWLPVQRSWKLNERHYGDLQGLNKAETAAKFGDAQVHVWRRSYDIPPNPLAADDPRHPRFDRRYHDVPADRLPATESLKDTLARVLEYWNEEIAPAIHSGKTVLIAAHGNSLRALVKHLNKISDEEISELNIPTAIPWLFELNDQLEPISNRYLGDPAAAAAAAEAVRKQSLAKK